MGERQNKIGKVIEEWRSWLYLGELWRAPGLIFLGARMAHGHFRLKKIPPPPDG